MATKKATKKEPKKFKGNPVNVCVVVSRWHKNITDAMLQGARDTFKKMAIEPSRVRILHVPGSYELPLAARWAYNYYLPDAIICLGCLIRGETPHFDYISKAVADGIMQLNLAHNIPVIFGVLTTDTYKQAKQRSGGKLGNKGADAALAAIEMISLHQKLKQDYAAESKQYR